MLIIRKLLNDVIDLFYPKACLLCRKSLIEGEEHLCMDCLCDLPKTNFHRNTENPAKELFAGYPNVPEALSFLFYEKEGITQEIVHSIKYYGNRNLARYMGRLAALDIYESGYYQDIDAIIPIPLHKKKKRKRGFNQSEILSLGISEIYCKPVDTKSVIRSVHTSSQTKKTVYDRHTNVENIFKTVDIEALKGKHVLLVDDVITTGATTSACIDALSVVPDLKISVFSLAIAGSYL
ncbi:MAG: ComF family protein [Tannerella sp.]|jgi:ComF family protein|nr:ComF family protein [Tannerella sp.]